MHMPKRFCNFYIKKRRIRNKYEKRAALVVYDKEGSK